MPSGQAPTPARAKALAGGGGIAWWQEDIAAARGFYEEALAIERELGDPARTADALYNLAFVVAAERDFEGSFRLFEESLELFRRAGDEAGVARADWMMPLREMVAGRWEGPLAKAEESVATWRRTGDRLRLEWREEGMAGIAPPRHRGFGTEQLERVLPDELHAEVECVYEAQGLRCAIALPLDAALSTIAVVTLALTAVMIVVSAVDSHRAA